MSQAPAGWDGILDPDESILWQGRPDGAYAISGKGIFGIVFGVFFAGFALFWMVMAATMGDGGSFWMFGLLHFSVGLWLVWYSAYGDTFKRRRTWYTLTNKRAFVATHLPVKGKQLKSYPITEATVLDFHEGDPPSVYFATKRIKTKNGSRTENIGFQKISQAAEVYRFMRDIQRQDRQDGQTE